ncbi:hypothetical protein E2C01_031455 [Portunus trituberculatus]|uniref:Uncharacterized protein n=1 Tax=Portunus trituberculatus TaxID=210409 RepID=A0A5B7EY53_PORTR|nr:hypothetical protein [Portunus trituberculatus]
MYSISKVSTYVNKNMECFSLKSAWLVSSPFASAVLRLAGWKQYRNGSVDAVASVMACKGAGFNPRPHHPAQPYPAQPYPAQPSPVPPRPTPRRSALSHPIPPCFLYSPAYESNPRSALAKDIKKKKQTNIEMPFPEGLYRESRPHSYLYDRGFAAVTAAALRHDLSLWCSWRDLEACQAGQFLNAGNYCNL